MRDIDYSKYKICEDGSIYSNRYNKDIARTTVSNSGYYIVKLACTDGSYITKSVHKIIAEKFIENPDGLRTVNHIDGNKLNNSVDNLEWMSNKDNCIHFTSSTDKWVNNARNKLHDDSELLYLERKNNRSILTYKCRICNKQQSSRLDSSIISRGLCTECAKKKKGDSSARY